MPSFAFNNNSTFFRLLVVISVLVVILLSLLSFNFISPRRSIHTTSINLNAPTLKPTDPLFLAICVPIQNDPASLKEFLVHHYHHLAIRRFYVVDQASEPPISTFYPSDQLPIPSDSVVFLSVPSSKDNETASFAAYNACQERFGPKHAWIGYLDVDEYIEQTQSDISLQDHLSTLDKNSSVGAFGINVLLHTSNGHVKRPSTTFRDAFTECVASDFEGSPNAHIKSIVKTKYYDRPRTDHNFITKRKTITIGEKGDQVPFIFRRPVSTDLFAIHHYALRSKEEFQERVDRGEVEEPRTYPDMWQWWNVTEAMKKTKCESMQKYSP